MSIRQAKQLQTRKKLMFGVLAVFLIVAIVVGVFIARQDRPSAISLSSKPPETGVSLLFNPPLTSDVRLEIGTSDEKVLKTVTLTRAAKVSSGSAIRSLDGTRYNIPLGEGVYRLVIKSTTHAFPTFTKTTTVSDHAVTLENIGFRGMSR